MEYSDVYTRKTNAGKDGTSQDKTALDGRIKHAYVRVGYILTTKAMERIFMARFHILFTAALAILALVAVSACAGVPAREDLAHSGFVLVSVDGVPFTGDTRVPEIAFSEDFRVSGSVCNRFVGQGELADGVLTVKQMASTKMLCASEELNRLEADISAILMAGARVSLTGDVLTLSRDGRVLVYKRQGR